VADLEAAIANVTRAPCSRMRAAQLHNRLRSQPAMDVVWSDIRVRRYNAAAVSYDLFVIREGTPISAEDFRGAMERLTRHHDGLSFQVDADSSFAEAFFWQRARAHVSLVDPPHELPDLPFPYVQITGRTTTERWLEFLATVFAKDLAGSIFDPQAGARYEAADFIELGFVDLAALRDLHEAFVREHDPWLEITYEARVVVKSVEESRSLLISLVGALRVP
jgi:hypothetical protein